MRLFIIGPMASGKSLLGRKLSEYLDLPYVDMDKEIELRAGAEISWIFEKEGEEGFRNRESAVLKESSESELFIESSRAKITQLKPCQKKIFQKIFAKKKFQKTFFW